MNNLNQIGAGSEWGSAPLCRRYLLAVFDDVFVYAHEDRSTRHWRLRWALGVLADGQREILGIWHDSAADKVDRQEPSDDLVQRGVETIDFISGIDLDTEPRMRKSYPDSTSLTSISQFLRKGADDLTERDRAAVGDLAAKLYTAGTIQRARSMMAAFGEGRVGVKYPATVERWTSDLEQLGTIYDLSPRLRRKVRRADGAAQQLNRNLSRTIARHCRPPGLLSPTSFIEQTLVRTARALRVPKQLIPPTLHMGEC